MRGMPVIYDFHEWIICNRRKPESYKVYGKNLCPVRFKIDDNTVGGDSFSKKSDNGIF
jgi:hypothetical protein